MKIALITDLHAGFKNSNKIFNEYFLSFFTDQFFPYVKNNKIKHVMCLGDVFDNRKYINVETLSSWRTTVFEPLNDLCRTNIILGNHDIYNSNESSINTLNELLHPYKNISIISEPTELEFSKTKILCIPWINKSNEENILDVISQTDIKILCGHLDIIGFSFHKGNVNKDVGFNKCTFDKFDLVLSGHYHHKSSDSGIHYLGSPYEMISVDMNDPKGFHTLDTNTKEIEFIQNPNRMFYKLIYDDKKHTSYEDILYEFLDNNLAEDLSIIKNSYVKILIKNKTNQVMYDRFIEELEKSEPFNLDPIEVKIEDSLSEEYILDETKDNIDIFKEYIKLSNINDEDKVLVEQVLLELYNMALEQEV